MKRLAFFALLAACLAYGLWPVNARDRRIVALGDSASAADAANALVDAGAARSRLGAAALSLAGAAGALDTDEGVIWLRLGLASVALPLEDDSHAFVSLDEGMRREEMASIFADKLEWTEEERVSFEGGNGSCHLLGAEGYLYPDKYLLPRDAKPDEVLAAMEGRFQEVYAAIAAEGDAIVDDAETIVRVASLIQREAAGKHDMGLVSGVIWNRVNSGMPLQIDATLQYVKGDDVRWWPRVRAKDKYLDSPFNTYENEGLPPAAIANPGEAAIAAAMRPEDTSCLFYIHDRNRTIHCASDYATHKRNIARYL
jgi:cell division protein YceG involved in septum cleavage